jgi:hypothetical protein
MRNALAAAIILGISLSAFAQSADAYKDESSASTSKGLLDPSRLTIHHSLSFGMASTSTDINSVKSQSLYTTMLQYKFAAPVTMNLNLGFPIYSTFSPYQNLNQTNLSSAQYFKNMPLDFALTWKPSNNFMMQLNVVRDPQMSGFSLYSQHYSPYLLPDW